MGGHTEAASCSQEVAERGDSCRLVCRPQPPASGQESAKSSSLHKPVRLREFPVNFDSAFLVRPRPCTKDLGRIPT